MQPSLYRKRYIPNEITHLKDDLILLEEENLIITSWTTLKPRKDIASGTSAYYFDQGFKVSKIYDKEHNLVYWYCDIIQTQIDKQKNTVIFKDLLVDVILFDNGTFKIVDLDELSEAFDQELITREQLIDALKKLNNLLKIIDENNFQTLQNPINQAEA